MIITSLGNSVKLAKTVAKKLKATYSQTTVSAFPDGDLYLKFNTPLKRKTLVIIHSFQPNPNESLFNITAAGQTAKELGAKKVILVAPYLAFMRQDKRFNPGECVTSHVMGTLLNKSIDKIITIDPHLHRYKSLNEVFKIKTKKLTANFVIADYIKKKFKNAVIMGPDSESYQWAKTIADHIGVESTVLEKTRYSSRKVRVKMIKPVIIRGKNIIIIDDIISTGNTIAQAAKKAKKMGAKSVTAIGVHGLFVDGLKNLKRAGVSKIVTTNCIEHKTNKIDVSELIVQELKK